MQKVLLVDTNFSSEPIYQYLCNQGYETHVVSGRAKDCLAKISANYTSIDYSETEALKVFIDQEQFDFIVPGCTDRSYTSCVAVNEGRFPGIESAEVDLALNDKEHFRDLLSKLGLPSPRTQSLYTQSLAWPLVVKPVDGFSGKGISILQESQVDELDTAIATAIGISAKGKFILEEFVEGQLHSHSAFLKSGSIHSDFIVEEHCSVNPFVVDTSFVLSNPAPVIVSKLRQSVEAIAAELNLGDGLLHTQFIQEGDNIWLIETTRRCPGDLYSQLIELSTDFNYVESYVKPFLGQEINGGPILGESRKVMRHTLTVPQPQSFSFLKFNSVIDIYKWVPLCLTGDQLAESPLDRIAILFAAVKSELALTELVSLTLERKLYQVRS
jgi:biotin carboxylase